MEEVQGPQQQPGLGPPTAQSSRGERPHREPPALQPAALPLQAPQEEHGNPVEGGQRLMLLRHMSQPNFPSRAREEITFATVVKKRIDMYWAFEMQAHPNMVDMMDHVGYNHYSQMWRPDRQMQAQIDSAKAAVRAEGCAALRRNKHLRRVLSIGMYNGPNPEYSYTACAAMHKAFQEHLEPHQHLAFHQQLHDVSWKNVHAAGFMQDINDRSQVFDGHDVAPEGEIHAYEDPIHTFVYNVFRKLTSPPPRTPSLKGNRTKPGKQQTLQCCQSLENRRPFLIMNPFIP